MQMRLSIAARTIGLLCALTAYSAAQAAEIQGAIRFNDENFSVDVRTAGQVLALTARGCNNFDLSMAAPTRTAVLVLHGREGAELLRVSGDRTIESRTCDAERYATVMAFEAPTTTTWTPEADESLGTKKVSYVARLSPREIRFDPTIAVTVFDDRQRPRRVTAVARITIEGAPAVRYRSDAVHLLTAGGTLRRDSGFVPGDEFSLAVGGRRLELPPLGMGSEIAFEALPEQPTAFSLYYPSRGPHVLAFGDVGRNEPTRVSSFRVDGEQRLTPPFELLSAEPLVHERGAFDFLSSAEHRATGTLQVRLGTSGNEVLDVQFTAVDPNLLSIGASTTGAFEPAVSFSSVPGGEPIEVVLRASIPEDWQPGEHHTFVAVTSEGGLREQIAITIQVTDRFRPIRVALLVLLVLAAGALALWKALQVQRLRSQQAAERSSFIQRHYEDYSRMRERIETLLAGEPTWNETAQVLEDFSRLGLQNGLTPSQRAMLTEQTKRQQARPALEYLERTLARFTG